MSEKQQLFDLIIIGASQDGLELYKYISAKNAKLNIAIVSSSFDKDLLSKYDLTNVKLIERKVIFSTYLRGVIGLSLDNNTSVFSLNVVVATGTKPAKLPFKSEGIYYKMPASFSEPTKLRQAIVTGNSELAFKTAIKAAKKFKYVYLCNETLNVFANKKTVENFLALKNTVYLPNSRITELRHGKAGNLTEVVLSTYDTLKCSAIIAITDRLPDVPKFNSQMLALEDGYVKINHLGETPFPKIYAVGGCTKYKSKRNVAIIGKNILLKNRWIQEE